MTGKQRGVTGGVDERRYFYMDFLKTSSIDNAAYQCCQLVYRRYHQVYHSVNETCAIPIGVGLKYYRIRKTQMTLNYLCQKKVSLFNFGQNAFNA